MVGEWSLSPVTRLQDYLRWRIYGEAAVTCVPPFTRFWPEGDGGAPEPLRHPDAPRSAFALGVELAFLSTTNPDARRVYERLGFQPYAVQLTFGIT